MYKCLIFLSFFTFSCSTIPEAIDLSGFSTNCNRRITCTKYMCKDYYYGNGCSGDKAKKEKWFINRYGDYDY